MTDKLPVIPGTLCFSVRKTQARSKSAKAPEVKTLTTLMLRGKDVKEQSNRSVQKKTFTTLERALLFTTIISVQSLSRCHFTNTGFFMQPRTEFVLNSITPPVQHHSGNISGSSYLNFYSSILKCCKPKTHYCHTME